MAEERDQYDLEPSERESSRSDDGSPKPRIGIPRPEKVEPLPIEDGDDEPPRRSSVRDLDVCPECGASMRGADNLICIRCGFDLKTMRKVKTVAGEATVGDDDDDESGQADLVPIITRGSGDLWLPSILAALSGIILIIGYLNGAAALYPNLVAEAAAAERALTISAAQRIVAVLQFLVLVGMLKACGLAALAFLAYMNGLGFAKNWDDLKLAAVRMAAIAATMRLVAFIALPHRGLEWMTEAIVQLVIFAVLSVALFRLKPNDAPLLTGAMAILFVGLWLAGYVIVWATWGT